MNSRTVLLLLILLSIAMAMINVIPLTSSSFEGAELEHEEEVAAQARGPNEWQEPEARADNVLRKPSSELLIEDNQLDDPATEHEPSTYSMESDACLPDRRRLRQRRLFAVSCKSSRRRAELERSIKQRLRTSAAEIVAENRAHTDTFLEALKPYTSTRRERGYQYLGDDPEVVAEDAIHRDNSYNHAERERLRQAIAQGFDPTTQVLAPDFGEKSVSEWKGGIEARLRDKQIIKEYLLYKARTETGREILQRFHETHRNAKEVHEQQMELYKQTNRPYKKYTAWYRSDIETDINLYEEAKIQRHEGFYNVGLPIQM